MPKQTLQKWGSSTLGDAINIIDGDRGKNYPKQDEFFDSEYCLFLNTKNVPANSFSFDEKMFITQEKDSKLRKGKLTRGDFVLTTRGTVGNFAYYSDKIPFKNMRINSGMVILRLDKDGKLSRDYFRFYLDSPLFRGQIKSHSTGSAQPQLPIRDLSVFKIEFPNLITQQQISDVLSVYDDLIENNARRIQILEQTAQAVYTEWFVNFRFPGHEKVKMVNSGTNFGEIPEGWEVKMIGDVCTRIQAGGTPRRGKDEFWDNGTINWYTTGELQDNFLFGSKEKITEQSIDETSAKIFDKGTILMAIYGSPTVGRLGITIERSSCNQAALGLVEDSKKITKTYLYYVLRNLREKFNLEAVGAAQQNISKIKVSETRCLVADRDLIDQFDVIAFPIFQEIESLQRQNDVLRQTRDLLLPKLVTGEIQV